MCGTVHYEHYATLYTTCQLIQTQPTYSVVVIFKILPNHTGVMIFVPLSTLLVDIQALQLTNHTIMVAASMISPHLTPCSLLWNQRLLTLRLEWVFSRLCVCLVWTQRASQQLLLALWCITEVTIWHRYHTETSTNSPECASCNYQNSSRCSCVSSAWQQMFIADEFGLALTTSSCIPAALSSKLCSHEATADI